MKHKNNEMTERDEYVLHENIYVYTTYTLFMYGGVGCSMLVLGLVGTYFNPPAYNNAYDGNAGTQMHCIIEY